MCNWKSGIVVRVSEAECEVYTLSGQDSHTEIRKQHGISEDNGALSRAQTPVEFQPARGCEKLNQFDLVYDAGKPDWVTPEMEERIKAKMFEATQADLQLTVWLGSLSVSGTFTAPKLTKAGNVSVYEYGTFTAPKLTKAGDVSVSVYGHSPRRS